MYARLVLHFYCEVAIIALTHTYIKKHKSKKMTKFDYGKDCISHIYTDVY